MGYNSSYVINVLPLNNETEQEEIKQTYRDLLEKISGGTVEDRYVLQAVNDGICESVKWNSDIKDLTEISSRHPEVILDVFGDGEDADDIWHGRFHVGEQEVYGLVGTCSWERIMSENELKSIRMSPSAYAIAEAKKPLLGFVVQKIRAFGGVIKLDNAEGSMIPRGTLYLDENGRPVFAGRRNGNNHVWPLSDMTLITLDFLIRQIPVED